MSLFPFVKRVRDLVPSRTTFVWVSIFFIIFASGDLSVGEGVGTVQRVEKRGLVDRFRRLQDEAH